MSITFTSDHDKYHVKGTNINFSHGTTCLGFLCKNFACVAADSRSSQGTTVASQSVTKIMKVNSVMVATMAGSAADCQYWSRVVGSESQLYELRNKRPLTVAGASKFYSSNLNQYKGRGLSVGSFLAGYDQYGPSMYYVDSEGQRVSAKIHSCGSGSPYALGVLDDGYREDLNADEATELARKCIYHATHRDAGSGGYINVLIIDAMGIHHIVHQDNFELFPKYINDPYPIPVR